MCWKAGWPKSRLNTGIQLQHPTYAAQLKQKCFLIAIVSVWAGIQFAATTQITTNTHLSVLSSLSVIQPTINQSHSFFLCRHREAPLWLSAILIHPWYLFLSGANNWKTKGLSNQRFFLKPMPLLKRSPVFKPKPLVKPRRFLFSRPFKTKAFFN